MQNKTHIKYLKYFIDEKIDCTYHSIIVFSDRCTLKNIKLTSDESKVINRYHVLPTVQSIARSSLNILSADQVDMVYKLLYPLTQVSDVEKAVHIQNIQSKLSPQILENQTVGSILKNETESSLNNSPICSKCDTPMILRKATRGERKGQSFYGCSNYPNCDFMTWNEPSGEMCPKCGKTLFRKKGKAGGLFCITDGCGYTADGKSKESN